MTISRREFVALAAGSVAISPVGWVHASSRAGRSPAPRFRAAAFDAFAVFDPRSVFRLADEMFPGTGLSDEWRTRQFEYSWLRVAARQYVDFWHVTEDALAFAARKLKLDVDAATRSALMGAFLELKAWPDVLPALNMLRDAGLRLAFLSNFTPSMLHANIETAGLAGMFEDVVSTDRSRTYKPDPRAYRLGVDALRATREEILFVAFAGWDAAGAKMFGYPTFWVNRQRFPAEELGVLPDGSGETLSDLVDFLGISRTTTNQKGWK
jgi:2-haloacid dehalogenase